MGCLIRAVQPTPICNETPHRRGKARLAFLRNSPICQNPDLPDLRINRIIEHDVGKSGKSFNQENRGSDNGKHRGTRAAARVAPTLAVFIYPTPQYPFPTNR